MPDDQNVPGAQLDTETPEGQEPEGKEPEGKEPESKEPVDYKFPENFTEDLMSKDEATELLKKHNASQEALDDLVPVISKVAEKMKEQSEKMWREQVSKWAEESANDKDFGGDKYDENIKTVIRPVIDKWGSPELVDILDQTGMAEHPAIMRFLFRIGQDVSKDGKLIFSDKDSPGHERSMAERAASMYPTMTKRD